MDRAFVEARKRAYEQEMEAATKQLIEELENTTYVRDKKLKKYLRALKRGRMTLDETIDLQYMPTWCEIDAIDGENEEEVKAWAKKIHPLVDSVSLYHRDYLGYSDPEFDHGEDRGYYFNRLLDSEPVHFEGDIIITDPCYITKSPDESDRPLNHYAEYFTYNKQEEYPDYNPKTKKSKMWQTERDKYEAEDTEWRVSHLPSDWHRSNCGHDMEVLGIRTYMSRDTLYGDWSCTTFNKDTKEYMGEFCADAGLVGVFLLDEVLKYNPDFDYHLERPWTTTWIKNFKGDVRFIVVQETGVYEDDSEYHKKGDTWEDFAVEVHGKGINTETSEPINFRTSQTGL